MKQSNDFRFKKLTDRREFFPDADGQIKPMIKDYFENGSFECKTEGRELRIYAKKKKETSATGNEQISLKNKPLTPYEVSRITVIAPNV